VYLLDQHTSVDIRLQKYCIPRATVIVLLQSHCTCDGSSRSGCGSEYFEGGTILNLAKTVRCAAATQIDYPLHCYSKAEQGGANGA
jgi:hypothetical protein